MTAESGDRKIKKLYQKHVRKLAVAVVIVVYAATIWARVEGGSEWAYVMSVLFTFGGGTLVAIGGLMALAPGDESVSKRSWERLAGSSLFLIALGGTFLGSAGLAAVLFHWDKVLAVATGLIQSF